MFMEIMMETIKHYEHVEIIDENNIEMTDVTISYYSAEHRERKTCKKYFVDITNRIIYTSYI